MPFLTEARHQREFCRARVENWQIKPIIVENKAKFAKLDQGEKTKIRPYFQMSNQDHKIRGDEEDV